MPQNAFAGGQAPSSPGHGLRDVTPSDAHGLPDGTCRSLYCLEPGTVAGITADGRGSATELFYAGQELPVGWSWIKATGTTATIQAIY